MDKKHKELRRVIKHRIYTSCCIVPWVKNVEIKGNARLGASFWDIQTNPFDAAQQLLYHSRSGSQ